VLEWINTRIMNANRGTNHELSIKKKLVETTKKEKQKEKQKEEEKEKKIKLTPY